MSVAKHEKHRRLIDKCKSIPATRTTVAHPCDASSPSGAMEAARLGLIVPTRREAAKAVG
jgi:hypothetical protein